MARSVLMPKPHPSTKYLPAIYAHTPAAPLYTDESATSRPCFLLLQPADRFHANSHSYPEAGVQNESFPLGHIVQIQLTFVGLFAAELIHFFRRDSFSLSFCRPGGRIAGVHPRQRGHLVMGGSGDIIVPRRALEQGPISC